MDYPVGYQNDSSLVLWHSVNKLIHVSKSESSILFLGQTNNDKEILERAGLFTVDKEGKRVYRRSLNTPMQFLSIHKAKGLEADNVVLLNF